VILRHGGEAQASKEAFERLKDDEEAELLVFLGSLVLFPPDHTASNLDPAIRRPRRTPLAGRAASSSVCFFNDPTDPE
jgi:hypothetical protein